MATKSSKAAPVAGEGQTPTHYAITVKGLVTVAGTDLLPGMKHRVKAKVFAEIDKAMIGEAVALYLPDEA